MKNEVQVTIPMDRYEQLLQGEKLINVSSGVCKVYNLIGFALDGEYRGAEVEYIGKDEALKRGAEILKTLRRDNVHLHKQLGDAYNRITDLEAQIYLIKENNILINKWWK